MIDLPGVNVLLALHLPRRENHLQAAEWLESSDGFATTPTTEMGLVRLLMNPAVTRDNPLPAKDALKILSVLKQQPHHVFWADHTPIDGGKFTYALSGYQQVTDLHLLEVAAARGGRLVTFDRKISASLKPADRKLIHLL